MCVDITIFYNDKGVLNRNRLKEIWVKNNLPELYNEIIVYNLPDDMNHFSQKMYHYINNLSNYPICGYCKNDNKRYQSFTTGYLNFCSKKCALANVRPQIEKTRRANTLAEHGVEHTSMLKTTKDRQRETNEIRYGGVAPACSELVMDKMKKTNKDRYDVEFPLQNKLIYRNYKNTCESVYGFDNPSKNKDVVFKRSDTRIKTSIIEIGNKYGLSVVGYNSSEFIIECDVCYNKYHIGRNLLKSRIEIYYTNPCTLCNPLYSFTASTYETALYEYLSQFNIVIMRNHRINNKEIDIYLPEYNLGIEINGLYWHSDVKKSNTYHVEKKEFFKTQNIDILHIWEDDWLYKNDIVKSLILENIGEFTNSIDIDSCIVCEISNKEAKKFINSNNICGYNNSKFSLGLLYNDELVSVMSFSGNRIKNFANLLNYEICGSINKLFEYFLSNYNNSETVNISLKNDYVSQYSSNIFIDMGFDTHKLTRPNYYWLKSGKRCEGYKFTKSNLLNMEVSYPKIYDSGNLEMVYSL